MADSFLALSMQTSPFTLHSHLVIGNIKNSRTLIVGAKYISSKVWILQPTGISRYLVSSLAYPELSTVTGLIYTGNLHTTVFSTEFSSILVLFVFPRPPRMYTSFIKSKLCSLKNFKTFDIAILKKKVFLFNYHSSFCEKTW